MLGFVSVQVAAMKPGSVTLLGTPMGTIADAVHGLGWMAAVNPSPVFALMPGHSMLLVALCASLWFRKLSAQRLKC